MGYPAIAFWPHRGGGRHPYEGFGVTAGGSGQPLYRVTTVQDAGGSSLCDAVSGGARDIVFDVADDIRFTTDLRVKGTYLSLNGTPAPGIKSRVPAS